MKLQLNKCYTGGAFPIKLESVKIVQTSRSYHKVLEALWLLYSTISDCMFDEHDTIAKIPDKTIKLMGKLLDTDKLPSFDPYIISMVRSYIRRKDKIIINMHGISPVKKEIAGLIIKGELKSLQTRDLGWNPETLSSSEMNLISPNIVSLFPNATMISVKTRATDKLSHPFNMFYLDIISKISKCKVIQVQQTISAKDKGTSWLYKVWKSYQQELTMKYKEHNFNVSFEQEIVHIGRDLCLARFKIVQLE